MDEFKSAIIYKMKSENTYAQLKAAVRAATEQILSENRTVPPPYFCPENKLLIQTLTEFFRFLGLSSTAQALEAESGTATLNLRRDFLLYQIGLNSDAVAEDQSILYAMVAHVQQFGQLEAVMEEE